MLAFEFIGDRGAAHESNKKHGIGTQTSHQQTDADDVVQWSILSGTFGCLRPGKELWQPYSSENKCEL